MTQEAWGLDPDGLLLLDVEVSGGIPESLAEAELQVQVGAGPMGWGCAGEKAGERRMSRPKHPLLTPQEE